MPYLTFDSRIDVFCRDHRVVSAARHLFCVKVWLRQREPSSYGRCSRAVSRSVGALWEVIVCGRYELLITSAMQDICGASLSELASTC